MLGVVVVFVLFIFQFSLRSRTPSLNGSIYSPYSSRKVSIVLNFYLVLFFERFCAANKFFIIFNEAI